MTSYAQRIRPAVSSELNAARFHEARAEFATSFRHLERAHVLGQASTRSTSACIWPCWPGLSASV